MPGLTDWKVLALKHYQALKDHQEGESYFDEYEKYEDVPAALHGLIKQSMFANEYSEEVKQELTKSLRLMPHYQNTGGFYIAVIEKIAEVDGAAPIVKEAPVAEETQVA